MAIDINPFDEISGVGRGRRLRFQDAPEGKADTNRLRLDHASDVPSRCSDRPTKAVRWMSGDRGGFAAR
ncbi:hypothetical protein [Streptomyces sp. NPDC052225]|uniref:hypothetical protein n=1 Tax=Streptomyces sp. NPDC052225 TaxID=3154949 RepID=UPI00342DABE2